MKKNIFLFVIASLVFVFSQPLYSYKENDPLERPTNPQFSSVDALIAEQKYQAAFEKLQELYKKAKAKKDSQLVTETMIRIAQSQVALHKYEEAVQFLREEQRPTAPAQRILVDMYYAEVLMSYMNTYNWEIQSREKTTHSEKDLKTWTKDNISKEILKAYSDALQFEDILSRPIPDFYRYYVLENSYPADVRPTLRDVVVYSVADHLVHSTYWSAKESNETYTLPFKKLLQSAGAISLTDTQQHPLVRLASLLNVHKGYHQKHNRGAAALEAQYVLFEKLFSHVSQEQDRSVVLQSLISLQQDKSSKRQDWWTAGQVLWAEQVRTHGTKEDGYLIKVIEILDSAIAAYPKSYGALKSAVIKHSILAPHFSLESMSHDATGKKSFRVRYKNQTQLFFRAYALDVKKELRRSEGGELWRHDNFESWKNNEWGKPVAEWATDLAPTKDYLEHTAFVKLPLKKEGAYIVVASTTKDFSESKDSQIKSIHLFITDIVMQRWMLSNGKIEVRAVSGTTGLPIAGVEISNWSRDEDQPWGKPAVKRDSETTGADGTVAFSRTRNINSYFQVAQKGNHFAHLGATWVNDREPKDISNVLIFTDRNIFRPQQKIFWKVLDYEGSRKTGQFKVAAKQKLTVELMDANYKVVATKTVTTNEFGTASGEFLATKDRALGRWQIVVKRKDGSYGAGASIKVEEYKRPTFEVTVQDSLQALRLNKKAVIGGEARYYFGQPVTSGNIKWRVERTPVWSWWWYGSRGSVTAETIASGTTKLAEDGKFKIEFTAKADERETGSSNGLNYQFTVHADVTDDGGETRSGVKSFKLGFVSLEAQFNIEKGYFKAQTPLAIPIQLSDLNGLGKSGSAKWQIYKLSQPQKTLAPAELPIDAQANKKSKYSHADDFSRARWDTNFTQDQILQSWQQGAEAGSGSIKHDAKGKGELTVTKGLPEGAYRIVYATKDEFGADLKITKNILIAGSQNAFALPLLVVAEKDTYEVGETARILIASGLKNQTLTAEIYQSEVRTKKIEIKKSQVIEIPITEKERGGFSLMVTGIHDYQALNSEMSFSVPWSDKKLKVEMATFRDKIRPGSKETFKITVKDSKGKLLENKSAELLAFMYDRSLDFFGSHYPPTPLGSYPWRSGVPNQTESLGSNSATNFVNTRESVEEPSQPLADRLILPSGYGSGPGNYSDEASEGSLDSMRESFAVTPAPMMAMAPAGLAGQKQDVAEFEESDSNLVNTKPQKELSKSSAAPSGEAVAQPLRSDFSETAFWHPHLMIGKDGSVSFEFQVPDSLTSWNFWATAITKDIRAGTHNAQTQSVKDLMVRPYLPRFLREGDEASLKVMINNASETAMSGNVEIQIENLETGKSALNDFGLNEKTAKQKFSAAKSGSTTATFRLQAPRNIRSYSVTVRASTQSLSDGEKRILPVLPSRMHLAQSRFVTLRNKDEKVMEFPDLAKGNDPSLINDRLVLTVDAQLFYGVLKALPYLITYPYECAEQTLNRFLSTGIVTEVFKKYPAVQKMAKQLSQRETPLEKFDGADANQRMTLEESPWLQQAEGGTKNENAEMANILDSRKALAERDRALKKLKKMQLSDGGFPWFDGGRSSEHITLYMLLGFARAQEFNVDVPKDVVVDAWKFMKSWTEQDLKRCMAQKGCHELVTMLNFILSSYKDDSWTGGVFTAADRKSFLAYSFAAWKTHSPLLKGYLALTLKRMDRLKDAQLVWASVMDSAKSTQELGTYWAPEERSWLWYNDTIETHAFALRVQMELAASDKKNDGLVQWLFLNKKLNHWKSTRATAESIYSLVHYLENEKSLGAREEIQAQFGGETKTFIFEPDKYTGAKNQVVLKGDQIQSARDSKIKVSKSTPGFAFASTTWHFSTEKVPLVGDGDLFSVSRKYFLREKQGTEWTLKPLSAGAKIKVGDQVEVQLSLKAKHAAEYVHLRDPRGAGFEPEAHVSGYRYDLGLAYYQEIRDSGGNFFFNWVPVGQYTFKYRLRANMAGTFRVGPATVQSLYAPEFNAYSQGDNIQVQP